MANETEGFPRGGLRMRSPDETLTFLKNNFGVIVRAPQKYRLKSKKELEQEERHLEKERRKVYNVKDKLDLYYSSIEAPIVSRRRIDDPLPLNGS